MSNTVIEVRNLRFKYNDTKKSAFREINFDVKDGEFFCIIGSNGSGKSSLCNSLVGLIPFYFSGKFKGDIYVLGENTRNSSIEELSKKIGLVFQNPFNQLSYTASTVAEELAYGLGNNGIPREEMFRRVNKMAKLMRIDHIINKNPLELSGGQIQRVALGSAFIMQPQILVLDECTTQLDPLGSEEIFDIVKNLNKEGVTVIMVDHDMERVARCASRIMVMEDGMQIAIDTPEKIFSDNEIISHGISTPDYTAICRVLQERGYYSGPPQIREEPTIDIVREALLK